MGARKRWIVSLEEKGTAIGWISSIILDHKDGREERGRRLCGKRRAICGNA